ncbi:hypothetical protein ES332_D06G225500v1 [Gossypium tomentosum]|uniref:Uncharacterized protein n=1 Tax=Gossypium tomentosum TaxID=34277 RepID=A0A5D2KPC6_GOSTO|nr:hypothetical protein ES332_D06G225500v1 [Gossypium tomentosum]
MRFSLHKKFLFILFDDVRYPHCRSPGDEVHQHKLSCALTTITAIQNHPLMDLMCY